MEAVIRNWYEKLCFPKIYDDAFYKALKELPVSDDISIDTYDLKCEDGRRNLLSFLYLCEALAQTYREKGIPEDILMATLEDIVSWTGKWSAVKGELFLGELHWLRRHMKAKIFRLGRLQFCMGDAEEDIPQEGIVKGDPVLEVHIPFGPKLTPEDAKASFALARKFFARYFPDYDYRCFTCHSWLLDEKLKAYLPAESNILRFAALFEAVHSDDSNALLRFIFRWDTNEENLSRAVANTAFAAKIQKAVMDGEQFHEVLGIVRK